MENNSFIKVYCKFQKLSAELKEKNNITAKNRYDCVLYAGDPERVKPFINFKGMLYLNLTDQIDFVKANKKRMTDFSLTGSKSLNFTGLYSENAENKNYFFGYPNEKPYLKNGNVNPMFPFRNDLYLMIFNNEFSEFELFILPLNRNYAKECYYSLINGEFDNEIEKIKAGTKQFYNYENPGKIN